MFVLVSWRQSVDHALSSNGLELGELPNSKSHCQESITSRAFGGHPVRPQAFGAAHIKTSYTHPCLHDCRCSLDPTPVHPTTLPASARD